MRPIMRPLDILLVDDQRLFIDSLKRVIEMEKALFHKVFLAYGGEEAIQAVDTLHPDVVLMDVYMPGVNGIEAALSINKKDPNIKIIMLSAFGYDDYVQKAIKNGAVGFVLKDISPDDLIIAIEKAYDGELVLPPQNASNFLYHPRDRNVKKQLPNWLANLSASERRILLLVSRGYSNREIADRMYLGSQTVRNYISTIYSKIYVENRFEAMRKAIEAGIENWVME